MRRVAWLLLVFGGCFNPTFHDPACGPNGECPQGTECVQGVCRSEVAGDASDGTTDDGAVNDGRMTDAAIDAAVGGPFAGCQNDTALVGCYRFETSSSPLKDGSMYTNDGTTSSGVSIVAGHVGSAMAFSGNASGVTVPHAASLAVQQLTLEAWINLNTLPTGGGRFGIIDKDSVYAMFVYSDKTVRCTFGSFTAMATLVISTGQWTHVACAFDASSARLYQDGTLIGTQSGTPSVPTLTTTMAIGMNFPSGDHLAGKLDEVKIWGRGLTASEVCDDAGC